MATYTVHVPNDGQDGFSRAERSAFVRDGFSWAACLFGPLFLLRHRAWLAAAAWVIGTAALAGLASVLRLPLACEVGLALLVMLFTGLEAATLRRGALAARGFDLVDVAEGSREEAERAYFRKATAAGLPARRTVSATMASPARDGGVIGFDAFGPPR